MATKSKSSSKLKPKKLDIKEGNWFDDKLAVFGQKLSHEPGNKLIDEILLELTCGQVCSSKKTEILRNLLVNVFYRYKVSNGKKCVALFTGSGGHTSTNSVNYNIYRGTGTAIREAIELVDLHSKLTH